MTTASKSNIIKKFALSKNDTGSPEVQIAALTEKISTLSEHLKTHKKDEHSRHGLIMKVNKRRKFLKYIKSIKFERYSNLIKALGLRQ